MHKERKLNDFSTVENPAMHPTWEETWLELREQLERQPACPDHPEYPCVRTLDQEVINDIVRVTDDEVVV
jgi:hypothetical protein